MPLFERPPLETLASAKDRWTPLFLERGRLEVDDSSVKPQRLRRHRQPSDPRQGLGLREAQR
ncbi:MAG: hypothetical protein KF791_01090 [Verrucomicrobiae bacterium]|nr:hypothetical protein [Verrucomicrobiae bacterium]